MLLRDLILAGLCSAVFLSSPAFAEGGNLDLRAMYQRKVEAEAAKAKASAPSDRRAQGATSRRDVRRETPRTNERASTQQTRVTTQRAMPVSVAPTVDVAREGNNGELRSSSQPRSGFFKTIFGEDAQQFLPETRTLDNALAERGMPRNFKLKPEYEPQSVAFSGYSRGTIVVDTASRYLYLVESRDSARRYAIAVGKEGLAFKGTTKVGDKQEWPRWFPTKDMQAREPKKYGPYKDGMNGGPNNPLGARAIYLYQGNKDTHIRIHGTNQPQSIGSAASNGCFRMINEHVMDLYNRVPIGAEVVVL